VLTAASSEDTQFPGDQGESELLAALVPLTQWVGLEEPSHQVYCTPQRSPPPLLPLLLSLLVLHATSRSSASPATSFLLGRRPGEVDGWVLLSGLATLLRQLHPQVGEEVSQRLEQARDSFTLASEAQEAQHTDMFLQQLRHSGPAGVL